MKIKKLISSQFFKLNPLAFVSAFLFVPAVGMGQSVLKNIENNTTPLSRHEPPSVAAEDQPKDERIYISQLEGIELNGDFIREEIESYWAPLLGKPVTNQAVSDFKEWAWRQFNQAGYFAFLRTESKRSGSGQTLVIEITLPTIKELVLHSDEAGLAEAYADQISLALGKAAQPGQRVDTLGLEQTLDNISFVLPISLSLSVRQVDADQVNLVINVEPKVAVEPGALRSTAIQVNNYGLRQYGRIEALGVLTFNGWTPDSSATFTAQGAEGLTYARMDYEAPSESLGGHVRLFGESVFSRNIYHGTAATKGVTDNFGVGETNILGADRDLVFKSYADFSHRVTNNKLQAGGVEVSSLVDNQARWKVAADNDKLATDNIQHFEANVVAGHDNAHAQYYFGTLGAAVQKNIDSDGLTINTKFRAQFLPSRNLDTYNRFSLGGVNGVRAYTTADGVGDAGALASVEVRQQYSPEGAVGVFYDGGVVNQNRHPVAGQYNATYSLQAVGFTWVGVVSRDVNYNTSIAKAVGRYAAYVPGIYETAPHALRLNFALSYLF